MRPATATIPIYEIFFLGNWQGLEPMAIQLKRDTRRPGAFPLYWDSNAFDLDN